MLSKAWLIPFLLCLSIIPARAQELPQTIRICDESGCSDRPRDSATFNPQKSSDPAMERRHAGLVALAESDPRAAYDLGLRHFRGDGLPQDSHQALTWMRNAASRGYLPAQTAVGRLYLTGLEEMGADPAEAEKWLLMASAQGDKEAVKLLADAQKAKQNEVAYQRWKEASREESRNLWESLYEYRQQWLDDDHRRDRHTSRPRRY